MSPDTGAIADSGPQDDAGDPDSGDPGDSGAAGDAGPSDAGSSDAGPECVMSADCDDGDECNGAETCDLGVCESGTALADGAACDGDGVPATRELCLAGACGATRCGDGYVDMMGAEECDDANDVSGDGCDDCRFSCSSAMDCDDGEDCNGAETCSAAHVCVAGTNLANGTACANGTGRCLSGACLPDTCSNANECDDGDMCNGAETCEPTGCAAATAPLDCDDDDPCTADGCASASGCTHTLIDADFDGYAASALGSCGMDCNDMNRDIGPDAPEVCGNMVDDNCNGTVDEGGTTTWYADCDADGYAAAGARTLSACSTPAAGLSMCAMGGGWTARSPATDADCNDGNASVNPGQTMFQTTAIRGAPMASDFDYDCDTNEERRSAVRGSCAPAGLTGCTLTEGWVMPMPPACGGSGAWVVGCTRSLTGCTVNSEMRQQACR